MASKHRLDSSSNATASGTVGRLAGGGALLTLATVCVGVGNAGLNAVLAQWMSPGAFGEASLIVTLMLVSAGIAATVQLVTARLVAEADRDGDSGRVRSVQCGARRVAIIIGVACAMVLTLAAPSLATALELTSAWPLVVFAWGVPFYLLQAAHRGALQGRMYFTRLAVTLGAEVAVRCVVTAFLVRSGAGTTGVAAGLTISFLLTWLVARAVAPNDTGVLGCSPSRADVMGAAGLTAMLLVAQVVINQADLVIVKASGPAADAGIYAVVALIGRAVYFCTWSVAAALFPAAARYAGAAASRALWLGVGTTAGIGGSLTVAAWIAGDDIVRAGFGPEYEAAAPLLAPYLLSVTAFAVANVIATVDVAAGRRHGVGVLLAGAAFHIALVYLAAPSLEAVVWAQLVLMIAVALIQIARRALHDAPLMRRSTADRAPAHVELVR